MKTVILSVFALCMSLNAMADVVFYPSASDSSACKGQQKIELQRYLNGKADFAPKCYKPSTLKSTTPTINNCKTAYEKMQLRQYWNGKEMKAPKCYKPATWVGHTRTSAGCSYSDKMKIRRILNGKADVMEKFPACYK